jgi:hypothetical protein
MLRTIGTEVSQLCVVILQQSIAAAARALTKDKVTDFVNYGVHWIPRANYQSNFDAIERKAAFRGDNLFVSPNGSRDIKLFLEALASRVWETVV